MSFMNVSCVLSGLAIREGDKCVVIPIRKRPVSADVEDGYVCETRPISFGHELFEPCLLPIHGTYDGNGGLRDIQEDNNTLFLKERFSLPIDGLISIFTKMAGSKIALVGDNPELADIGACFVLEEAFQAFLGDINTGLALDAPVREEYLTSWGFEESPEVEGMYIKDEGNGMDSIVSMRQKRVMGYHFNSVATFQSAYKKAHSKDIDLAGWLKSDMNERILLLTDGLESYDKIKDSRRDCDKCEASRILAKTAPALRSLSSLRNTYLTALLKARCVEEYFEFEEFFLAVMKCRMVWMPAYFYMDADTTAADSKLDNVRQLISANRKVYGY